jgi:hypothetical protein
MGSLTAALLELGFTPVLGTAEADGNGAKNPVHRGAPKKHDCNNGVAVVYDEAGAPWIVSMADLSVRDLLALVREHGLQDGAYVPHSNDGGRFISGRIPSVGTTC